MSPRRVAVIPNGVDLRRVAFDPAARDRVRAEHGIGPGDYVIGVLGRLDANKRFDLVIEAAAPLLDAATKLMIVGKGDEYGAPGRGGGGQRRQRPGRLHRGAARRGRDAVGHRPVRRVIAQETFGLSVLEALANGAPAIYTTCPALAGIEVDGRARQVPGTVAGMREALAAEVSAGRRERLAVPAVEAEYGIEAVAGRIDDLYERLAGPRAGGSGAAR